MALQRSNTRRLEQTGNAARHAFDDVGLAFLHGRDVHLQGRQTDAVSLEFMTGTMKQL